MEKFKSNFVPPSYPYIIVSKLTDDVIRAFMTMNDEKILKLAKTDFHLFPDAGKP